MDAYYLIRAIWFFLLSFSLHILPPLVSSSFYAPTAHPQLRAGRQESAPGEVRVEELTISTVVRGPSLASAIKQTDPSLQKPLARTSPHIVPGKMGEEERILSIALSIDSLPVFQKCSTCFVS